MKNKLLSQILSYSTENLQPLLDNFKKLSGRRAQSNFYQDQWVQFAVFALSKAIRQKADYEGSLISQQTNFQSFRNKIMKQPTIIFLSSWLSKIQGYSTQSGKTQKDRKNSFFRLIVRHLKKTYKKQPFYGERKRAIQETQQKLNKNTISNQVIEQLQMEWNDQIREYLASQQILMDLLRISKSKSSRYFFILHLDCIKSFASQGKLGEFQFYIKVKVEESVVKIIDSFYSKHQKRLSKEKKSARKDFRSESIFKQENQSPSYQINYYRGNQNLNGLIWFDADVILDQRKSGQLLEKLCSDSHADEKAKVVNQEQANLDNQNSFNSRMFEDD